MADQNARLAFASSSAQTVKAAGQFSSTPLQPNNIRKEVEEKID